MIIEILDGADAVITKVSNVSDPDAEVTAYGGVSWRKWVQPDDERVEKLRRRKLAETKAEGLRRVGVIIPAMANINILDLIVEAVEASMMVAPQAGSDMEKVKQIYLYAKTRITAAQTATEDQLNAYDPATDPGWPTT